ncbi:MAG: hypothetical protein EON90_08595 [Brevundimonas sp.]|nr:MAG: hypothetical protein EON90_08595 [Brevundimonas sp.]
MRPLLLISGCLSLIASAVSAQTVVGPGAQSTLSPDVQRSPGRYLQIEGRADGAPTAFVVTTESPNLPSNVETLSIRAVGRWEVCEGFRFTGECKVIEGRYQRRQQTGLRRIFSARPVEG